MPFQIKANADVAYRGRFLLFHGLNDSPFVWRDFAKHIAEQGFDVRAVLLKGHGSHPRNMLDVSASDWLKSATEHYNAWMMEAGARNKAIYVGGFSMGALLANYLALEQKNVQGLLLVSPAYHSKLNNILSFSWLYSRFQPWLFGGMITEDNPTKYNSISINAAAAYYALTQKIKAKWGNRTLNIPVLMLHSIDDSVVDVAYSRKIFQERFNSSEKKLLLYAKAATPLSLKLNEERRDSGYLNLRIINQSHLSLINSSANLLLGKEGRQLICNGNKYPIYMACINSVNHWYGAQHTLSPDGVAVARTTYNPDFSTVLNRFNEVFLQ
ncbi:MAG: alpha/beta fold hydrolase [Oceanospirillaceae bacterium]